MGGYDRFIFSLFYFLHVSAVLLCCSICCHQFISCRFIRYPMSVFAKYMLCVCVLFLQSCGFICSLMLVANMRCISCQFFSVMVHESCSHVFDLHMFHMIYDLACIFTVEIIDIMISMINISLYVIIMLLNYGIKMTWKLPIILTSQKPNHPAHSSMCRKRVGGVLACYSNALSVQETGTGN